MLTFGSLAVLLSAAAQEGEWPRWRGPEGDGISRETEWKPESLARPKLLWRTSVGEGHSSVVVSGGRLWTMGNFRGQDVVTCLDAATGKPAWRLPYRCAGGGFPGPRATPTLHDGKLYTLSRIGDALCLDAATGKVLWQKDLMKDFGAKNTDYGLTGSPLVAGDAVIYNACGAGLALDRTTGEKIWASAPDLHGYASPVAVEVGGTPAVAIFSASSLVIVDPADGKALHTVPWRTSFDANAADPVVFGGKMLLTSGWDRGAALFDLSGGAPRRTWESKELRGQFASPVHLDGHLYGIDDNTPNGRLTCIDAATGKATWSRKGGFENLMVAGDKILAVDRKGILTVAEADPAAYREVARARVFTQGGRYWTAPVLAGGLLYCRQGKGELVCVDVR